MNIVQQTAARFREVLLNGTWVANTNYRHQLQDMEVSVANRKIGEANSIALLAQHIHYYLAGVKKVLEGGSLDISDQYSFDFAPIETQQEWNAFLNKFWHDAEVFAQLVEQMDEQNFSNAFVLEKYGNYLRNIDCMIEHAYYHLGQIVLLRKLLLQRA